MFVSLSKVFSSLIVTAWIIRTDSKHLTFVVSSTLRKSQNFIVPDSLNKVEEDIIGSSFDRNFYSDLINKG